MTAVVRRQADGLAVAWHLRGGDEIAMGGIEARHRAERGQAVGAADSLRGRQAAALPVADDLLHPLGPRRGIAQRAAALAGAAVADGDRPVVEQVNPDLVVVVPRSNDPRPLRIQQCVPAIDYFAYFN